MRTVSRFSVFLS